MTALQYEFNLENLSESELQMKSMQSQIDEACESMGKVRRRLFAQMADLKKDMFEIKQENESLRAQLKAQSQS